ncbi:gliding motility-associated C-terminal domain-containing protein [Mucilaginibacter calamicampi]|uniref:Gliding motility-associated C-terminal domain-containing protein n=1 Tax=Mucilaginibacter calamicampi TaxID=1302352 RepID=A0ABW2Z1L4_9SPHI
MPTLKKPIAVVVNVVKHVLVYVLFFLAPHAFSQIPPGPITITPAPHITYPTPHLFTVNTPITPIEPTNSGTPISSTGFTPYTLIGYASEIKSLVATPGGLLYGVNYGDKIIRRYDYAVNGGGGPNSPIPIWNTPTGATSIAVSPSGGIFIADYMGHTISQINTDGTVSVFAGSGVAGFTDGAGTAATFNQPYGLAFDVEGNLYVADMQNHAIRKVTADGIVTTLAGKGIPGHVNGALTEATFNFPGWLATDEERNIYVSENGAIRKITPDGEVSTVAGIGGPPQLANIDFNGGGIKVDEYGNIYAAHRSRHQIVIITPQNNYNVLIGSGFPGYDNDNTSTLDMELNAPQDISFDAAGNIFIADQNNDRFIKLMACGYVINKPLPPGLVFEKNTGIISGTPTSAWPLTDYVITAFIHYTDSPGKLDRISTSSATISIEVNSTHTLQESIITFPPQSEMTMDANGFLDPKATSTNNETPIVYKNSSNTSVAIIQGGKVKIVGPGVTVITATQVGNANYWPANVAAATIAILQNQQITFPAIASKIVCDADFSAGASTDAAGLTITYTSSNPSVATVNSAGLVHIVGAGITTITASQAGNSTYGPASAVNQQLTVTTPPGPAPNISITADADNVYPGIPITFNAIATNTGTTTDYQWKVNGTDVGTNNATYTSNTLKNHDLVSCTITTNVICAVPLTSSLSVTIKSPLAIKIINAFSPNGDGINDNWDIPDLSYYPNCLMNIYSRGGQLVFQSRGYFKPWDGSNNGRPLPAAAYYYVLLLEESKQNSKLSGHVTLVK